MASGISNTAGTTWTYSTGIILDTDRGERPKEASKKLLETRAVQVKGGWLGQIIMDGEIVREMGPFDDDEDMGGGERALEQVNLHILGAFKKLIVGG